MSNLCTSFHNMRPIVIVMLVVTMCYPVLINTAAVRSSELLTLDEQLLLKALAGTNNTRISRSTENSEDEVSPTKRYCYNTPCGWAVYTYVRTIEYYMRNTCECPDNYICVRAGDDLSASAYVYRCRQKNSTSDDDIRFPEDAN